VSLSSSLFPAGAVGGRENCTKQGPSRLFRLLRPLCRESNLRPVSSRSRASARTEEETDFNVGAALSRAATVSCVARSHLRRAGRSLLSCRRRPTSSQFRRLQLTAKGCESIAKGRSRSRRRRPRLPIPAPPPRKLYTPRDHITEQALRFVGPARVFHLDFGSFTGSEHESTASPRTILVDDSDDGERSDSPFPRRRLHRPRVLRTEQIHLIAKSAFHLALGCAARVATHRA
jgi:hypothetical protein